MYNNNLKSPFPALKLQKLLLMFCEPNCYQELIGIQFQLSPKLYCRNMLCEVITVLVSE